MSLSRERDFRRKRRKLRMPTFSEGWRNKVPTKRESPLEGRGHPGALNVMESLRRELCTWLQPTCGLDVEHRQRTRKRRSAKCRRGRQRRRSGEAPLSDGFQQPFGKPVHDGFSCTAWLGKRPLSLSATAIG